MKYVHQSGVSTRDLISVASLTTLVVAILWPTNESLFSTLSTGKIVVAVLITSGLLTGGFICLNQSLNSSGLASVVLVISAANPLIGSAISLFYLGEGKKVILPMIIVGSLLTICGTIMVGFSSKNN